MEIETKESVKKNNKKNNKKSGKGLVFIWQVL